MEIGIGAERAVPPAIDKAIRYMSSHMGEKMTVNRVASTVGVTDTYLCSMFQKHVQTTPMRLYTSMRMQYACRMLRQDGLRVCEVAELLGYDSQYYFSKVFKKIVGIPPIKYRNGSA